MKSGNDTFVSPDSQVYQDLEKFNQYFSGEVVIVLLKGDDLTQLLQPGNVSAMESLEDQMSGDPKVVSAIGPAFVLKQVMAQQIGSPVLPDNADQLKAIVIDPVTNEVRTGFNQIFPDNEHALIAITLASNLPQKEQSKIIREIRNSAAAADFDGIEITITGTPVLVNQMMDSMNSSMRNMLILSIGIMLVILALIFSVRGFFLWRWLPLGVVMIAIIYAFGAMGVLSIPITMVTMTAFPILIGLGVDYAIQFHNRYDEEARRGETAAEAIIDAVTHIGPTIGIAIIAACLGFAALFFSPVPMIQDFGLTLILGVIAAYLLSVFFLLAILYSHDRRAKPTVESGKRKTNSKEKGTHVVDKGLRRLAPWAIKNPAIILPVALVLCVGGLIADSHIKTETDSMKFISQKIQPVKDLQTAVRVLGGVNSVNLFVEAEDVTDPDILKWMVQSEQQISQAESGVVVGNNSIADLVAQYTGGTIPQDMQEIDNVLEVMPASIKRNLVTDDHTAANMTFTLSELTVDQMEKLKLHLVEYAADHPDGVKVTVTGSSVFMIELNHALTGGRLEMDAYRHCHGFCWFILPL